jgi:hypothetical protein
MSGRHVIHTGLYMPFNGGTNDHLNTSYTLLPTYLKRAANYSTHMASGDGIFCPAEALNYGRCSL